MGDHWVIQLVWTAVHRSWQLENYLDQQSQSSSSSWPPGLVQGSKDGHQVTTFWNSQWQLTQEVGFDLEALEMAYSEQEAGFYLAG